MAYRLVTHREDYRDLAGGFVFRSAPGFPAFPVRLAQELFLRSASHLPEGRPIGLWDPCCGSGYLASVVGLLNRERLRYVFCSDIDPRALLLADGNLRMLTAAGLAARRRELGERAIAFDKASYDDAVRATERLGTILWESGGDLTFSTCIADAFDLQRTSPVLPSPAPDLVVTDVPYGRQTAWLGTGAAATQPLAALARSLCRVLPDHAIIAVCAEARKVSLGEGVGPLERFRVGKRAAIIVGVDQLRGVV